MNDTARDRAAEALTQLHIWKKVQMQGQNRRKSIYINSGIKT